MKRPSGFRKTVTLSDSLQKRVNMYALAGSAAGALALANPAEAKIVYTPAHVPIHGTVNLDLNHDGIVDFKIDMIQYIDTWRMEATSLRRNRVWGSHASASRLLPGVVINSNLEKFHEGANYCGYSESRTCKVMATYWNLSGSDFDRGPWAKQTIGYLGLKFYIGGKVHFGWARLRNLNRVGWVLTGYAYETIAGKPIVTGEEKGQDEISSVRPTDPTSDNAPIQLATLGLLATGSAGLSVWRREESVATAS